MTPEERAEKIISLLPSLYDENGEVMLANHRKAERIIAAQIQQAVDDGFRKDFRDFMELFRTSMALERTARQQAFEEAAMIAEVGQSAMVAVELPSGEWISETVGEWIARRIRARAKEVK